jgi:peptidoglycan/LPS O-acetylase OafA/YrhL
MRERLGHRPALDGLRGVAILAVTGIHFFNLSGGFFGVDLFFVLSGFLITTLLLETEPVSIKNRLRTFYGRRARRLLPALGVVLLFCVPLAGLITTGEASLYISNVIEATVGPNHPLRNLPLDHLWSLAEEEQFYLIWPVLLLVALRHLRQATIARVLVGVFVVLVAYRAALVLNGASWNRIYFAPDTHADGLVLGCLIAFWRPLIPAWSAWLAAAATLAFFALGVQTSTAWLMYGLPAFEICAALLVIGAVDGHVPLLASRPLVWLGLISYSLYLWQQPARFLAGGQLPSWRALPVAFVLAIGSYYVVEKRFRRRRQKSNPVASPAPA